MKMIAHYDPIMQLGKEVLVSKYFLISQNAT